MLHIVVSQRKRCLFLFEIETISARRLISACIDLVIHFQGNSFGISLVFSNISQTVRN